MRALKPIVLLVVAFAASALAYCDGHPTVEQEFNSSALVFVGKVISAEKVRIHSQSISGGTSYAVEVTQALKGRASKTVHLYSENSSARFPMRTGEQYLIFADYDVFEGFHGRKLAINSCGNSARLSKSDKTLETVRRLTKT
jgi:hypothetical protein